MAQTIDTWEEAYEQYDDDLDELSTVQIGSLTYSASRVLREIDPIAYREGLLDWLDSLGIDSDSLEGPDLR